MKWYGLMLVVVIVVTAWFGLKYLQTDVSDDQVMGVVTHTTTSPTRGVLVPHHLLVRNRIEQVFDEVECKQPCRVVFISPLHQGVRMTSILWAQDELKLADQFFDTGLVWAEAAQVEAEHTIQDVVPILEAQWPGAKQTQIMVSNYVPKSELDQMVIRLANTMKKDTYLKLVVSVDFSHYLPVAEAGQRDARTLKLLSTKNYEKLLTLNDEYVDGRKALYVFLKALEQAGLDEMELLGKTNSGILMNNPYEQTTSHFYAVFR